MNNNQIYMLWDESHLWGLMLIHALSSLHLPFSIITAQEIKQNILQNNNPALLIIPGGWSRLKAEALGSSGRKNIIDYVSTGGNYLGFCGGAGLALSDKNMLGLCSWGRKPMKNRLPNFSGYLKSYLPETKEIVSLPVWWPSQFKPQADNDEIKILASYLEPDNNFWASDLHLSCLTPKHIKKWEELYGINLDPQLLHNEPCIIKGRLGNGQYILSYAHLETPSALQANRLLLQILSAVDIKQHKKVQIVPKWELQTKLDKNSLVEKLYTELNKCIELGKNNFLLFWRESWLLGWRRGIPGSPLNTLYALASHTLHGKTDLNPDLDQVIDQFITGCQNYLLTERQLLMRSPSSPEHSSCSQTQQDKLKLFGSFPGYGGLYGILLHELDNLLLKNFIHFRIMN